MKNIFLFALCVLFFAACSEDFKVGADYKEVTVVYGLLDDGQLNNKNYIKVTRGFFSETENNLLQAKIKDSIYFNDITVKVEELQNGNAIQTFILNEVDLDTILTEKKQDGVFLVSPNIAYELEANLNPEHRYKLTVTNNETGKVVTAETPIINSEPNVFKIDYPISQFDRLGFSDPLGNYNFTWNGPPDATLFDIVLRFYYWEEDITTQQDLYKFADLPLGKFIEGTGPMNYKMDNSKFYSLLTGALGAGGNNIRRYIDTPTLTFVGGSEDLKRYIDINTAQGGLTNDQIKPIFTNLIGEDVIGIFSTIGTRRLGFLPYTDKTWDSIQNSTLTRNLNFAGRSLK